MGMSIPGMTGWGLLAITAILVALAYRLNIAAFKLASGAIVAPFRYLSLGLGRGARLRHLERRARSSDHRRRGDHHGGGPLYPATRGADREPGGMRGPGSAQRKPLSRAATHSNRSARTVSRVFRTMRKTRSGMRTSTRLPTQLPSAAVPTELLPNRRTGSRVI